MSNGATDQADLTGLIAVNAGADHGDADSAYIFVHGYKAVTGQADIEQLKRQIETCQLTGNSYLFGWAAGSWRPERRLALLHAIWRFGRYKSLFNPALLALDAGLWGAGQLMQYRYYERRADRLGEQLLSEIQRLQQTGINRFHLIGHSLGARVIFAALNLAAATDVPLGNVIMLGGVLCSSEPDWERVLNRIDGRLVNCYSRRDAALRLLPTRRRLIGLRPLEGLSAQQQIINFDATPAGHLDYWNQLQNYLTLAEAYTAN